MTLTGVVVDFEEFYREVHPRLVSTLAAVSGDRDVAIDSADEAAARALAQWHKVGAMARPDGWVYRVGLNHLRRQVGRRALESALLRRRAPVGHVEGPTGEMWQLVSELSPRQRQAVALRHLGQLTEPEIAVVMGVRRGTVSSTLRAAYANLADSLSDDDAHEETEANKGNVHHAKP